MIEWNDVKVVKSANTSKIDVIVRKSVDRGRQNAELICYSFAKGIGDIISRSSRVIIGYDKDRVRVCFRKPVGGEVGYKISTTPIATRERLQVTTPKGWNADMLCGRYNLKTGKNPQYGEFYYIDIAEKKEVY